MHKMRINYSEKRNNINKPDALRSFCVACETFNFRETVQRLVTSLQVVTRTITELEELLDERRF
mgnify:FL=1